MPKIHPLDLSLQYAIEADYISNICKRRALLPSQAKNIVTAGDIVERTVREIISKKIPNKYYTNQGHIVDQNLSVSGQFDVIITDDKGSPVLASFENGTDFLAYESIYAIGEIKSSFSTKHKIVDVVNFIEKVKAVTSNLRREEVDIFQQTQDFKLYGNSFGGERTKEGWLKKNPLFKFMFFVNSKSLKLENLVALLNSFEKEHQPNLICFLDRGILVKVITPHESSVPSHIYTENYPEFQKDNLHYEWKLLQFKEVGAATLAYLIHALNVHLSQSILAKADLMAYQSKMYQIEKIF